MISASKIGYGFPQLLQSLELRGLNQFREMRRSLDPSLYEFEFRASFIELTLDPLHVFESCKILPFLGAVGTKDGCSKPSQTCNEDGDAGVSEIIMCWYDGSGKFRQGSPEG